MRIYRKEGDQVQLIAFPDEHVQRGDYLLIEDPGLSKGLLVQVIDLQYANVPGILEDILRDVMTDGELAGEDMDPLNISSEVEPLKVGYNDGDPIQIDASGLDGGLNIITGRKGTGKSHLAKLLLLSMAGLGAPCIVLDVNGEYVNLHKSKDGRLSTSRLTVIAPRSGINFALAKLGYRTMAGVLSNALDLPATSSKVFSTIWRDLESKGDLTLPNLIQTVQSWSCHESVREALISRLQVLL